jgi:hypothetical protein
MENNYDIFKQIEQQHPLPETFDPNTFRPVYNGRELNTNSYYPPDETPAPMYFNYNKFAEPPVSAYFGSSVNAVELLEDPSLVPVIDRRVDPNKIFNSDVQSFKTLAADQFRMTKLFEKKLTESLTEKGKIGLTEDDITAMQALTSARAAIASINREQVAVKKTIAELKIKQQQQARDANNAVEAGGGRSTNTSSGITTQMLDDIFMATEHVAPMTPPQMSGVINYDSSTFDPSLILPEVSDAVEYEARDVHVEVHVGPTGDTPTYIVAVDKDGSIVENYPLDNIKIVDVNRDLELAKDSFGASHKLVVDDV